MYYITICENIKVNILTFIFFELYYNENILKKVKEVKNETKKFSDIY